ncbi:MAG: hypothetical protein AAFR37_09910 [Cyanobacteria bacterium J06628_3]
MQRKLQLSLLLLTLTTACVNTQSNSEQQSSETTAPEIVNLTQTGCQFLETESKDYEYQTTKAEDCKQINNKTLSERKQNFKPLTLKPGKYTFRVTNQDVPYELGFYLRGEGVNQVTLPKVSGGGLNKGDTQDYQITLKPGKYVFSCPLNPTPDYPITVQ